MPVPVAGQVFFVTTGVAGTAIGALAGAAIGAAVLGVPATVVGGAGAGVLGGAAGNALGGGTELAQAPTVEPLVEVAALPLPLSRHRPRLRWSMSWPQGSNSTLWPNRFRRCIRWPRRQ
ncbi:hypothetical protein Ntsu_80520 [Nocardia sp. IFM 10818]